MVYDIPMIAAEPTCDNPRQAYVACVLDGDTFDIGECGEEFGERVRMLGINAPEIAHEGSLEECYGNEAGAELARLIDDRTVILTFDAECYGVYGRTLAYVWLSAQDVQGQIDEGEVVDDGSLMLQEWLLSRGYVRLYDEDFSDDLRLWSRLVAAEQEARARGLGLWSACADEMR